MHSSRCLQLTFLLAISVCAIPTQPAESDFFGCSTCDSFQEVVLSKYLAHQTLHTKPTAPEGVSKAATHETQPAASKQALSTRDIKDGGFTRAESKSLQQQANHDTQFVHLIDTLHTLFYLFKNYKVKWALGGGLALKLHGMDRSTTDVDVVVNAPMDKIKQMLESGPYLLPGAWWVNDQHLRVFFEYQSYIMSGDSKAPKYVEVDLIVAGYLASPTDLAEHSIVINQLDSYRAMVQVFTLQLNQIFKSKVTCALRTKKRAPKQAQDLADAQWILENKPDVLKPVLKEISRTCLKSFVDQLRARGASEEVVKNAEDYLLA